MTVAIGFLIFANILRSFLSFSSSNMYIFIYIYISFLFSRRRSPLKPRGDQSITRSFEPSSRNGIIVLSSVLTPSFLPSSCLPPRLFILNRFYTHSYKIFIILYSLDYPRFSAEYVNRKDHLSSSSSFFQARTHECWTVVAGGFEKTGWSIIIVMMGWQGEGRGERKEKKKRPWTDGLSGGGGGRRGGFSSGGTSPRLFPPHRLYTKYADHDRSASFPWWFFISYSFNLWNGTGDGNGNDGCGGATDRARNDLFIYSSSRYFEE